MLTKHTPSIEPDNDADLVFLENAMEDANAPAPLNRAFVEFLQKVWVENHENFRRVRQDMVAQMRRVNGQYDPKKLQAIKAFRGSEIYNREVEKKARAAVSWIEDIYRGDTELPWDLKPTELVDLPEKTNEQIKQSVIHQARTLQQKMQQTGLQLEADKITELITRYHNELLDRARKEQSKVAKKRCERAAKLIRDQNQEGNWDSAFKDFLYFFVRLKFAVIKGPILKRKPKQVWEYNEITGAEMVVKDELVMDCYCVSPFNFFPQAGMKNINDGNIIEIHELTLDSLHKMIGVPGYSDNELRMIIAKVQGGKLKPRWFNIDDEKDVKDVTEEVKDGIGQSLESVNEKHKKILAQEFYGTVSGMLLKQWEAELPEGQRKFSGLDSQKQYQANVWRIDGHIFKAVLAPDPLGRKPYHVSSWAKNPQWVVGEGMVEFGGPIEDAMNAVLRAAGNNVAIASGPLCEIDKDRVDMRTPLYPWRQLESTSDQMGGNNNPAVNYYQPDMHVNELTQAYMFFSKLLDELTVPAYAQGAQQKGVTTGTATVFTQLLAAASRSIKAVVSNIDNDIIKSYMEMCYDYNMKYSDDQSIKGDARVVAQGVIGLQAKEQAAQRKVEFLQVMANPTYQQLLGQENMGAIISQIAKSQDIKLPDTSRLTGEMDLSQELDMMLRAQVGATDGLQANGQMGAGGGAPTAPQGLLPDGSKAGVANAA
jgi:hypothetical protein